MKIKLLIICFFAFALDSLATGSGQFEWKEKAPLPGIPRHRANGWSIGNKGYIGLGHINSGSLSIAYSDWWEYDPATNAWTQKADYPPIGGRFACSGFVIGNKGYVGCGNEQNWGSHAEFYEFDPLANTWTQKATFPYADEGLTGFAINGKGYMGKGGAGSGFYEYDPVADTWSIVAALNILPWGDYGGAFVINNKGYIVSGGSQLFYEFNPVGNVVTAKANFPISNLYAFATFQICNKGHVVMGGIGYYTDVKTHYIYDPATNQWDTLPYFPGMRRHYVPGFSIGNKGYIGTGSNGTNLGDFWEYAWNDTSSNNAEGINEQNSIPAKVFPTPASQLVNIQIPQHFNASAIYLYNLNGTLIRQENIISTENISVERNNLPAGTYLFVLKNKEGKNCTGKILFE